MDSDALREHFLAGTRQEPCPFGDDAVEWDHSRYSRALGLTAEPGLHDLPHTGAALVGVPAGRWPGLADSYREWCGAVGWRFVFASARPSVLVPDGIAYALGDAIAGPDSLIFARSGHGGAPALGPHPRAQGMSMPLTTGERWLMATDRVRRRVRSASAQQGLLLFLEEAQCIGAASMNLIAHLLDAHRAWKARMLSRDARVYTVLVTTPERQGSILRALERHGAAGSVLRLRSEEREGAEERRRGTRARTRLTAEDEHLVAALAASPLALEARDLALLFGSSSVPRAEDLARRDILRRRVEYGRPVFAPNPSHLDGLPPPPERVLRALLARLRRRSHRGRGQGHVHAAMASLAFRLGEPRRALACLGRMSHADDAVVPAELLEEIDGELSTLAARSAGGTPAGSRESDPGTAASAAAGRIYPEGGATAGSRSAQAVCADAARTAAQVSEPAGPGAGISTEPPRPARPNGVGGHATPRAVAREAGAEGVSRVLPTGTDGQDAGCGGPPPDGRTPETGGDFPGSRGRPADAGAVLSATGATAVPHAPPSERSPRPESPPRALPLRAGTVASWVACQSHQHNYTRAKELLDLLARTPVRDESDLYRTLTHLLCMGRTHLDQVLPDGFWATLTAPTIDPALLDTICILADLFARIRLMTDKEILERFEVVEGLGSRIASMESASTTLPVQSASLLQRMTFALFGRLLLHVRERIEWNAGGQQASDFLAELRDRIRSFGMPGYLVATTMYAAIMAPNSCRLRTFDNSHRSDCLEVIRCTGNPFDQRIQLGGMSDVTLRQAGPLLLRGFTDELVLLLPRTAPRVLRWRFLQSIHRHTAPRAWAIGVRTMLLHQHGGESRLPAEDAYATTALALGLLYAGDLSGATDSARVATAIAVRDRHQLPVAIYCSALVARRTCARNQFARLRAIVDDHEEELGRDYVSYLRHFVTGCDAFLGGDLSGAAYQFLRSREALRRPTVGERQYLWTSALMDERQARFLHGILAVENASDRAYSDLAWVVSTIASRAIPAPGDRSTGVSGAVNALDAIVVALDTWARRVCTTNSPSVIAVALALAAELDGPLSALGTDSVSLLALHAPAYFRQLEAALMDRLGVVLPGAPATRAARTGLLIVADVWGAREGEVRLTFVRRRAENCWHSQAAGSGSLRRQAKSASRTWMQDASAYWVTREALPSAESGPACVPVSKVLYGHVDAMMNVRASKRLDAARQGDIIAYRITDNVSVGRSRPPVTAADASLAPARSDMPLDRLRPQRVPSKRRSVYLETFVGSSPQAVDVRHFIDVASRCALPVLLIGETGVGKEVVARQIHACTKATQDRTLVVADCTAVAAELAESHFFGHVRGAFTGAVEDHAGLIAAADGSTLLIDDLDSMAPRVQASLLRVLETGEYRPVGAAHSRTSRFRLITLASTSLMDNVTMGVFRHDLYYRISTLRMQIAPLRARGEDVIEIARASCARSRVTLCPDAEALLLSHPWWGNVRELLQLLKVAIALSETRVIPARVIEALLKQAMGGHCVREDVATLGVSGRDLDTAICKLVQAQSTVTAERVAHDTGVSLRSAQRRLARLCRLGRIARFGAGRATRYESPSSKAGGLSLPSVP